MQQFMSEKGKHLVKAKRLELEDKKNEIDNFFDIVAVNDLTPAASLEYLLKYLQLVVLMEYQYLLHLQTNYHYHLL